MSGFESVGQILPRAARKGKVGDELFALQVKKAFLASLTAVFVEKKLPKISAGKFSYGVLTISVPDPAWAATIRQKESQILKNLNSQIGKEVVEKLRFRVVARY